MNCPNCNMPLEENMHFCGHCGMPIYQERTRGVHRPPVQNGRAEPPPEKSSHALQWCLIAGLLALCICAGLFSVKLIMDRRKQNDLLAEQRCYYGTIKGNMRWDEARDRAQKEDYYLARINSREEYDNLTNALNEDGCQDRSFILGARRPAGSQDFYWDGDEPGSATPLNSPDAWCSDVWKDGAPGDTADRDGYILMYYDEETGRWVWTVVHDDDAPTDEYLIRSDREIDETDGEDLDDSTVEPLVVVDPTVDPVDHPDPNPPSPEPVPEPDPAPDPEPSDVLSGLSAEKRKALNQFMSNFSEVSFGDFERGGTYDEATLAEFAFMHCKINYTWADRIAVDTLNGERYDTITGKNVDEVLNRYLGVTITHKSYDWYGHTVKYENGKYYQPWAMGDICTTFSVVTEMVRDGDRYRVTFDVYDLDLGICGREDGIGDRYYSMTGAEAKACGDLTYRARGTAVLEDYRYNDYDSYRLISYQDPIHTKQETGTEAPPEAQDDCLSELRDIRGRGMDGHAFRYDANGDGESELFILYTEQDAPQNLWGEICTMQDGTLVRIHGPEKLCVLAGQAGGVIGAVQIDGKNYLEVCSYIHSTEATDGQDTERWCLYDVSKSGFTMTREVDYSRRFGKWDDETTFTYDITDNGKTMTKEQYDAFRSPMIGVHLMASSGTDAHWADDNGGDDNHPVSIRTLDEMCAELERGGLSQIAVPAGEEAEPAAPETFDESNYTIVNSNLSWSEAQAFAARRGGTLAAFETEAEFRFVVDLIEREGYRDVSFLLGGRRDPEGDTYYWVDGNDEFYGGPLHGSGTWYDGCWTAGDPNYEYNGREETVVMMSFESGEDRWTWFDGTADYRNPNRSYGFIIEYDG